MTKYNSNYDAFPFSDLSYQINLVTNTQQTITIPGIKSYRAEFSYPSNANVYVGLNVTAVTPGAGTNTNTANIEFKPKVRYVKGGQTLSFVTSDVAGTNCGVSLLELPS